MKPLIPYIAPEPRKERTISIERAAPRRRSLGTRERRRRSRPRSSSRACPARSVARARASATPSTRAPAARRPGSSSPGRTASAARTASRPPRCGGARPCRCASRLRRRRARHRDRRPGNAVHDQGGDRPGPVEAVPGELGGRRAGTRVERGVFTGRAPFGYRKRADGRSRSCRARRAKVREGVRGCAPPASRRTRSPDGFGWSHSTRGSGSPTRCTSASLAARRLRERERAPGDRRPRDLFDAVQAGRTTSGGARRDDPRPAALGLARCGGCGRTLKVVRRQRADGSYVAAYYCKNAATEPCPERAYVHRDDLDAFVAAVVRDAPC